jgi:hypothetical protein
MAQHFQTDDSITAFQNDSITAFRKRLYGTRHYIPTWQELIPYVHPGFDLTKIAEQIATTTTEEPMNPREYTMGTLEREFQKATRPKNTLFVDTVGDEFPKLPPAAQLPLDRPLLFTSGRTWSPRVLAKKAGKSVSKVYSDMRQGKLGYTLRRGLKRIPSNAAHAYIQSARQNA